MINKILETTTYLKSKIQTTPEILIVLGSGLGDFVKYITNPMIVDYKDIPHFHQTSVEGHEGKLYFGKIGTKNVVVMQGRFHTYEGYDPSDVVFPMRAIGKLGIQKVILTNAAGGINPKYKPGDLVIVTDHINLTGRNPLIGKNIAELGPRFPDMTESYNKELNQIIRNAGKKISVDVKEGVYCGFLGPTYETPAEIRMVKAIGGDLVGMSTVLEVIALQHMGIKVSCISCVTNFAAGISKEKLTHEDVKKVANEAKLKFGKLLDEAIKNF
jgi:purine-nucleoside phosphorylase